MCKDALKHSNLFSFGLQVMFCYGLMPRIIEALFIMPEHSSLHTIAAVYTLLCLKVYDSINNVVLVRVKVNHISPTCAVPPCMTLFSHMCSSSKNMH